MFLSRFVQVILNRGKTAVMLRWLQKGKSLKWTLCHIKGFPPGKTAASPSQLSDSVSCQEVWVTAGVRWGRYRMYTHTHVHPKLFYIGCEKQLPPGRKPTGQTSIAAHVCFCQNEKRLGATRRTETSLLNGAEIKYAWQAKSHNFYRFGKSNYARRSLHSGGLGGRGKKIEHINGIKRNPWAWNNGRILQKQQPKWDLYLLRQKEARRRLPLDVQGGFFLLLLYHNCNSQIRVPSAPPTTNETWKRKQWIGFSFFWLKWRGGELIMEIVMMVAVLYWMGLCFYEEILFSIHTSNVFWTSHVICAERHLVRILPNRSGPAMQHLSFMRAVGEKVVRWGHGSTKRYTYRTHRQGPRRVICCKKMNKWKSETAAAVFVARLGLKLKSNIPDRVISGSPVHCQCLRDTR